MKVVLGGPAGGSMTWELETWMRESYPEIFHLGNFVGRKSISGGEL